MTLVLDVWVSSDVSADRGKVTAWGGGMWGSNKETCCDFSDQNIQQVHYKFDFRIRTWYIINLHVATGEKKNFTASRTKLLLQEVFHSWLHPDFSVCILNVLKSHICCMKNHTYILHFFNFFGWYSLRGVILMQIWALAPCCVLSAESLFSDGMLYSAAFSSIEWIWLYWDLHSDNTDAYKHLNYDNNVLGCSSREAGGGEDRCEELIWVEKPRRWWKWWLAIKSTGCHLWITAAFSLCPRS